MTKSRSYTLVNVPEVKNLKASFVYNFFVSDERVNDSGDPRIQGIENKDFKNILSNGSLNYQIPRYNIITFIGPKIEGTKSPFSNEKSLNSSMLKFMSSEETITNVGFACLREVDEKAQNRLKQKINAISKVNGIDFSDTNQSKKISEKLGVDQKDIQSLISPVADSSTFLVNSFKNV